ncbi:hypothetical protein TIFTF001_025397 [Ficus carica]|uniref:Uncharacterized protein n=1 Tax=Ficus carica TaxID=3494 RepID=A0AA88ANQ0_FICCA|nr:hypothetical protein TIFTF001_025397 [Ficus carica]
MEKGAKGEGKGEKGGDGERVREREEREARPKSGAWVAWWVLGRSLPGRRGRIWQETDVGGGGGLDLVPGSRGGLVAWGEKAWVNGEAAGGAPRSVFSTGAELGDGEGRRQIIGVGGGARLI